MRMRREEESRGLGENEDRGGEQTCAYMRFFSVYSWPQKMRESFGRAPIFSMSAVYICTHKEQQIHIHRFSAFYIQTYRNASVFADSTGTVSRVAWRGKRRGRGGSKCDEREGTCCGVPELKLPQPATKRVSPVNTHAGPSGSSATKVTCPGVWQGVYRTPAKTAPGIDIILQVMKGGVQYAIQSGPEERSGEKIERKDTDLESSNHHTITIAHFPRHRCSVVPFSAHHLYARNEPHHVGVTARMIPVSS